jgi:alkylation response protein AidB-like acyl-CoA dehydrogenase
LRELEHERQDIQRDKSERHNAMMALTKNLTPGAEATMAMMCRRTVLVNALLRGVEKALELGGGAGFYRAAGLERCFRDIQGSRFHPIPERAQTRLVGRFLLGLDLDG